MRSDNLEQKRPATILFTHYGDEWIRGSERCLLDLVTHIDRDRFSPVIWCNSEAMVDNAKKLDVPVYRSEFPLLFGWKQPRLAFKAYAALIRQGTQLVDTHGVDLVHANSGAPNQWMNLVARARRIPLLTHLHSRNQLRDRLSLGLHQVSMAVGVSQPVIDQLLDDGMLVQRTRVVPNGIDTRRLDRQETINLRDLLDIESHEFLIATTGSLIHRKGTDLIIDAVFRLVRDGFPIKLAIIGDGPERTRLQQQVQHLDLQDRVHLLGERPNVAGLLRGGVNLFVSAAREEVFGLALAEAGLAGLAVVAPAVGGIPGVVVDGHTGRLFPPQDQGALTHAIRTLYLKPSIREEMARAGRRHILRHFTIQHNSKAFEQLYDELLQDATTHMRWYSHWQLRAPLITAGRKLLPGRSSVGPATETAS